MDGLKHPFIKLEINFAHFLKFNFYLLITSTGYLCFFLSFFHESTQATSVDFLFSPSFHFVMHNEIEQECEKARKSTKGGSWESEEREEREQRPIRGTIFIFSPSFGPSVGIKFNKGKF